MYAYCMPVCLSVLPAIPYTECDGRKLKFRITKSVRRFVQNKQFCLRQQIVRLFYYLYSRVVRIARSHINNYKIRRF